jgi:hypothetical protein
MGRWAQRRIRGGAGAEGTNPPPPATTVIECRNTGTRQFTWFFSQNVLFNSDPLVGWDINGEDFPTFVGQFGGDQITMEYPSVDGAGLPFNATGSSGVAFDPPGFSPTAGTTT